VATPFVWELTEADAPAAGALLARAFASSPNLAIVFPDADQRAHYFAHYFPSRWAAATRLACRLGGALGVGTGPGDLAGVALWRPEPPPPNLAQLETEAGFGPHDPVAGPAMARVHAMLAVAEAGLGEMPPTWRYLDMIGVDPARQVQGFGSALLRRLLADAEAAGEAYGLLTDEPAAVPFYERAGLDRVWSGTAEDGALPLWSFRSRLPQ